MKSSETPQQVSKNRIQYGTSSKVENEDVSTLSKGRLETEDASRQIEEG